MAASTLKSRPGQSAVGMAPGKQFSVGNSTTGTVNASTGAWAIIDTGLSSVSYVLLTSKKNAKVPHTDHGVILHWYPVSGYPGRIQVYSSGGDADEDNVPLASINFDFLAFGTAKNETREPAVSLISQSAA